MKQSKLHSLLYTDLKTLLYRLCFALCPAHACWPTPDHRNALGERAYPHLPGSNEHEPYEVWSTCVLWGNGLFWNPVWGHSASHSARDGQDARQATGERTPPSRRNEAGSDHAVGRG